MAASYSQVPAKALKKPEPFKIEVPEKEVEEFKQLLKLSKIPAPTYESLQEDRKFGVSHKWMTEAKRVWESERKCEAHMNSFPNFISTVNYSNTTFKIHFIALFSSNPDAIPVALFHGWPGNFLEFLPILSLMKKKYTPSTLPYHLVVPSLPGYSFSSTPPLDRDFTTKDIAGVMNQLLVDLGFGDGYIAQGGDIGSRVSKFLGQEYDACKAVHVNFSPRMSPNPPEGMTTDTLSPTEKAGQVRGEDFIKFGSAYALEHATRPATIGITLGSSPLALLAWIGEKFLVWTDEDPPLETILESVTLYWFTESMGRGIFPYRGRFAPQPQPGSTYLSKPLGYSNFPKEIMPTPKAWVEKDGNLVFYREHEKGGHFAALEQPELLMADVEDFVKQVWTK